MHRVQLMFLWDYLAEAIQRGQEIAAAKTKRSIATC